MTLVLARTKAIAYDPRGKLAQNPNKVIEDLLGPISEYADLVSEK
jgi:hypothetical protein